MKKLLLLLLLTASCATLGEIDNSVSTQHKWNAFEQRWEIAGEGAEIKWNAFEQEWEY